MQSGRELMERCRWPDGVVCPWCAGEGRRLGTGALFQCLGCRAQFSVIGGTVLGHSRVPLEAWVAAVRGACSPEGVNARELQELAGMTYKAAVGMMQRLREAGERAGIARRVRRGHELRLMFAAVSSEEALRAMLRVRPETREERLERAWANLTDRARGGARSRVA
jgi:hypothetical protein